MLLKINWLIYFLKREFSKASKIMFSRKTEKFHSTSSLDIDKFCFLKYYATSHKKEKKQTKN